MTDPTLVAAHLKSQQTANPGVILLAAQYYNYQQYKTNAYTNGDVTVSNDRIYDVTGRNPYETKTAFAVAPMEYHLRGNAFAFKLQSNMVYTNTALTLSTVEIDFGNGQGYQAVSLNTVKNVSYTSGGVKELKVKFVYSGGPTLYNHARLYVDYIPSTTQGRFNGSGAYTLARSEQNGEKVLVIESIVLSNNNGEKIYEQTFKGVTKSTSIDASRFGKGIYFLKISSAGYTETHRIIINK